MSKSNAFSSESMQRIAHYSRQADKLGISYGQYIARMEEKKRERAGQAVKAAILKMKQKAAKVGKDQ